MTHDLDTPFLRNELSTYFDLIKLYLIVYLASNLMRQSQLISANDKIHVVRLEFSSLQYVFIDIAVSNLTIN